MESDNDDLDTWRGKQNAEAITRRRTVVVRSGEARITLASCVCFVRSVAQNSKRRQPGEDNEKKTRKG